MTATRWNAILEWPLTAAALPFLAIYTWQVLTDHNGASEALAVVLTLTWAMFAVDYVGRLVFAEHRGRWFVRHLLDLAVVALPILRPLRLVRLVILLAVFQRFAGRTLRGQVVTYVAGTTVMLVFVAALAVLDSERHEPDATIVTFGDALWWACSTITTVGYGDVAPVLLAGRCIAVGLMLGGIALLGTVTATIASWIVQRVAEEDNAGQAVTAQQVEALVESVETLTRPAAPTLRNHRARQPRVRTGCRRLTLRTQDG